MNFHAKKPDLEPFIVGGKQFFPIAGYNKWSPNVIDIPMFIKADGTWDAPYQTVIESNPVFPRSWFTPCFLYNPTTKASALSARKDITQFTIDRGLGWITVDDMVNSGQSTASIDTSAKDATINSLNCQLINLRAAAKISADMLYAIVGK